MGQPASFVELRDTPFTYSASQSLAVNSAGTAIVYENRAWVTLVDAPPIAVDASLGTRFVVTMAASRQLANPTNARDGQFMIIEFIQGGAGGNILTFDTQYTFGQTLPSPVLSTSVGAIDFLGFIFRSSTTKWYFIAEALGY